MMAGAGDKRRVRNAALGWMAVALLLYLGYIALAVYRSRH